MRENMSSFRLLEIRGKSSCRSKRKFFLRVVLHGFWPKEKLLSNYDIFEIFYYIRDW